MIEKNVYIGDVEALEIAQLRGIEAIPERGFEVLTVHAIASGLPIEVLGKDANGFYIREDVNA